MGHDAAGSRVSPDPLDRPRITRSKSDGLARIRKADADSTISKPRYGRNQPPLNHEPTILRVEYKNDTISTKPSYISDSPTPTDTQKQKTEGSALTPLQALQKNGKIPMLQFWETWRYSLVKFRTIYRALV